MSNFDLTYAFKFTARGQQFAVLARTVVIVGGYSVDLLRYDDASKDYLIVGNAWTGTVDPFSPDGVATKMGFRNWWNSLISAINAVLAKIFQPLPSGDPTNWEDFNKWLPLHLQVNDITLSDKP